MREHHSACAIRRAHPVAVTGEPDRGRGCGEGASASTVGEVSNARLLVVATRGGV
jgi:hypothetical protein